MSELIVIAWQYFIDGETIQTEIEVKLKSNRDLNDLARKIAKENGISTSEIFFIFKER